LLCFELFTLKSAYQKPFPHYSIVYPAFYCTRVGHRFACSKISVGVAIGDKVMMMMMM
jgi:hypothetical protein